MYNRAQRRNKNLRVSANTQRKLNVDLRNVDLKGLTTNIFTILNDVFCLQTATHHYNNERMQ